MSWPNVTAVTVPIAAVYRTQCCDRLYVEGYRIEQGVKLAALCVSWLAVTAVTVPIAAVYRTHSAVTGCM